MRHISRKGTTPNESRSFANVKDSHVEGMPSINETVNPEDVSSLILPWVCQPASWSGAKKKRNRLIAGATTTAIILTGGAFVAGKSLGGVKQNLALTKPRQPLLTNAYSPTEAGQ